MENSLAWKQLICTVFRVNAMGLLNQLKEVAMIPSAPVQYKAAWRHVIRVQEAGCLKGPQVKCWQDATCILSQWKISVLL